MTTGVSGEFSVDEVLMFERCIPNGVSYVEPDVLVMKAEGPQSVIDDSIRKSLSSFRMQDAFPRMQFKSAFLFLYEDSCHSIGRLLEQSTPSGMLIDSSFSAIVGHPGEKSQRLHIALWNLDRVDQRRLPLDKKYHYGAKETVGTGAGVTVYVLDSGINPYHREFLEWSEDGTRASYGYDFVDDDNIAEDCDGHGSHVASTVIGRAVGIAKQARVVAVRVLDCQGSGNISTTVAGLDWVAEHYEKPAVVALSLGVSIGRWSQSLEESVRSLVKNDGLTVVVAAGNNAVDSCSIAPANVPETITVAASDLKSKFGKTKMSDWESVYRWSNSGKCVDLFAPGVDIYAGCGGKNRCETVSNDSYTWASGTSMAVPHVAGVAAVYLGDFPYMTPDDVKAALVQTATTDRVGGDNLKPGTPNRLLYSKWME